MKNLVLASILAISVLTISGCSFKSKCGCSAPSFPTCTAKPSCGCK